LDEQIKNIEYDCDSVPDVEEDINYDNHFGTNDDEHQLEDILYNKKSPKSYSSVIKFQVGLSDIVNKHKASLQMYDDVCSLVNEYTSSHDFYQYAKLQSRKTFLKSIEEKYGTHTMKPNHCNVRLHDNTCVTVPVFDTKTMIKSLLTDKSIMKSSNFAEGYNVLTGDVDNNMPCNQKYGEVHTGDGWLPAKARYYNVTEGDIMPVALIVFGDKSHSDLHGALSLTPIIFTLTLFN
jgi:hypothetical protein